MYSKTPCVGKRLIEPSQPFSNIRMENTYLASHFPKPAWKTASRKNELSSPPQALTASSSSHVAAAP